MRALKEFGRFSRENSLEELEKFAHVVIFSASPSSSTRGFPPRVKSFMHDEKFFPFRGAFLDARQSPRYYVIHQKLRVSITLAQLISVYFLFICFLVEKKRFQIHETR